MDTRLRGHDRKKAHKNCLYSCIYTEIKMVFGFRKVVIAIPTLSEEVPKEFREQSVNFSLRSTDYLSADKAGFVIKNIPRNDVEFNPA